VKDEPSVDDAESQVRLEAGRAFSGDIAARFFALPEPVQDEPSIDDAESQVRSEVDRGLSVDTTAMDEPLIDDAKSQVRLEGGRCWLGPICKERGGGPETIHLLVSLRFLCVAKRASSSLSGNLYGASGSSLFEGAASASPSSCDIAV